MIVIGGGIAGLAFARDLAMHGHDVTLFESSPIAGGVLQQRALGHLRIDSGAESFAIARPEARDLVDELGMSSDVVTPARSDARLALPSGTMPLPTGLLGIPIDLDDPRVIDVIGSDTAAIAASLDRAGRPVPSSLGQLVRQQMGPEVTDLLVDPVMSGVHACRADDAEIDTVVPRLRGLLEHGRTLREAAAELRGGLGSAGAAVASLQGGMSTLAARLVDDLLDRGVELHLATPARAVTATTSGGWTVTTDAGALESDQVCVAIPAHHAARLLVGLGEVGIALSEVRLTSVAVVALLVRSHDLDTAPVGSGVLVAPSRTDVRAKAMTHATAKWQWLAEQAGAGMHVLRLSFGRAGEPIAATDEQLMQWAIADASRLTGVPVTHDDVVDAWVQHWTDSLIEPRVGHAQLMARVRAHASAHAGLTLTGSCLGGNGLAGIIADARSAALRLTDRRDDSRKP